MGRPPSISQEWIFLNKEYGVRNRKDEDEYKRIHILSHQEKELDLSLALGSKGEE